MLRAQNSESELLSHASDDINHGRYSSAKVEIEEAIALGADHAEPWYQLGLLYGQMANYHGAEQAFRHALTLDPHSAKAHCRLGQTLVADPEVKEDWGAAVEEFRAALQIDPAYPEAESLLGLGLMHLGDRKAAIATLRHAIQLHPDQASAHLNLALALEEQADGEAEAVEEYRAALALKPNAPETEAALGTLLLRAGRIPEAEQAFRRSLQLNPDLPDALFGLARVLKKEKKTAEAGVELELAAQQEQRKPNSAQAIRLSNEALQLAAQGDMPGALADLRKAIQLEPDYGIAKYNLGLVLADTGDFADAKESLIDAVSLLPGQATIWFDLGRVLAKLGDERGALETVSWATRLSPGDPRFTAELKVLRTANPSSVTQSVDGTREQDHDLRGLLSKPPFGASSDTVADRVAFAEELKRRSDYMGTLGELQRALKLQPNSVEARTDLADAYAFQAQWERAIEEYRKVLLVAGDGDANVHLALGKAFLASNHAREAAEQFEAVLKLEPNSSDARASLEAARQAQMQP